MTVAPWTMTDEGEWVLNEPYASHLAAAKRAASDAWMGAVYQYLSSVTGYDVETLNEDFMRRVKRKAEQDEDEKSKEKLLGLVDSYIIEVIERSI